MEYKVGDRVRSKRFPKQEGEIVYIARGESPYIVQFADDWLMYDADMLELVTPAPDSGAVEEAAAARYAAQVVRRNSIWLGEPRMTDMETAAAEYIAALEAENERLMTRIEQMRNDTQSGNFQPY